MVGVRGSGRAVVGPGTGEGARAGGGVGYTQNRTFLKHYYYFRDVSCATCHRSRPGRQRLRPIVYTVYVCGITLAL